MSLTNNRLTQYLIDAKSELKKVIWPTKEQTRNHSLLVIGISLGVAVFLGILDYFFNLGVEWVLNR